MNPYVHDLRFASLIAPNSSHAHKVAVQFDHEELAACSQESLLRPCKIPAVSRTVRDGEW